MTEYAAPLNDMQFVIEELIGLDTVAGLPGHEDATEDLVRQVLTEAGRFGSEALAPLNRTGDTEGSRLENGVVVTPTGFADAYKAFVEGGWNGVPYDPNFGGQGLPQLVATATSEIWASASFAFSLCSVLTQAGIEMLFHYGSDEQKETWLPKLVSGEWTGAMVMTEPHAGSDIGELRTRAVRDGDRYRLTGQKCFISWGEHDMTDNIVHMVLARTEDSPPGVKGLSLFIVPKFLVNADGSLGQRNDMRAVMLEHKLGIHASPTAIMSYGDDGGAIAYLIGEENRGIEYMFAMMNNARLAVGLEGMAIAERAYQQARDYALTRVQGRDLADPAAGQVAIIRHPDVRRMLMTMRAGIEAMRALSYSIAAWLDVARLHPDAETRKQHQARIDFLIPVAKAWSTDLGFQIASTGVQVHGGAGFIEETGAAQHLRDARIPMIYEGANGIQALDLVRRKLAGDDGAVARELLDEMRALDAGLAETGDDDIEVIRAALADGADALGRATDWMLAGDDGLATASGATPYLELMGTVIGGFLMARSALIAHGRREVVNGAAGFYGAKINTARFFAEHYLSRAGGLERAATAGAGSVMSLSETEF